MAGSNNTVKDVKLQSSLQFFHARVKNQLEDVKLQREIRLLDRRIGMTNSEFKREFQAVKKEMQNLRKSSGRSKDGWVPEGDETLGSHSAGKRNPEKSTDKIASSARAKSAVVRGAPKSEESVWERLNRRPASATDGYKRNREERGPFGNYEQRSSENGVELLTTKRRLNAKACSKLAWRKRLQEWDSPSSEPAPSYRVDARGSVRPRTVDEGVDLGRKTTKSGIRGTLEPKKQSESTVISDIEPNEHIFQTEPQERRPSESTSSYNIHKPSKGRSLREILEATPTSDGHSKREQWLKSALKTKRNKNIDKRVTILENGELHESYNDANNDTVEHEIDPTGFGMISDNSKDTKRTPSLGLLSLLMNKSDRGEATSSPTPNVIPEVRRNPKQSVEDVSLKKRRDTLLKASIISLMGGGLSKYGSPRGKGTRDSKDSTDDEVPAGGTASPRRFSFRLLGKTALARNHLSVQKRSTLGVRLKVRPVVQSAMTAKSIQANLAVYDSDSDEPGTPATPMNSDSGAKSKISKSWRNDSELEKPPVLEDDLKQLQIHLAASHLSRERELQRMQQDQEVDHLKVIDDDRKQSIMSKVTSFTSSLQEQKLKEQEEERRRSIFGGPSRNSVVNRWRNAAKGAMNIRS